MYNRAVQSKLSSFESAAVEDIGYYQASGPNFDSFFYTLRDLAEGLVSIAYLVIICFVIITVIKLLVNMRGGNAKEATKVFTQDYVTAFNWGWGKFTGALSWLFGPLWRLVMRLRWVLLPALALLIGFNIATNLRLVDVMNVKTGQQLINLKDESVLAPGRHLIFPFFNQYILVHTANYTFEIPYLTADSSEPQDVNFDVGITFKFDTDYLFDFYRREGAISIATVTDTLVSPKTVEAIKNVVRQYSYKDILAQQTEVKEKSLLEINKALNPLGIIVTDLTFINIIIPRGYVQKIAERDLLTDSLAIEKQRLEEAKLVTDTQLELANREKQRQIIEAEGIAEANRITSAQTLTPEILELKKLEIQRSLIEKWDGDMPDSAGDNFSLISQ